MNKTDSELMAEYGITSKTKTLYSYKQHTYEHLKDAFNYAKTNDNPHQKDRICEEVKSTPCPEFNMADQNAFKYYGGKANGYERRLNDIENDQIDSSWIKRGLDLITGNRTKQDIERNKIRVKISNLYHERDTCMDGY